MEILQEGEERAEPVISIILTDEYLLPQFKVPFEPVSLLFSYFFLQVLIIVCSYSHVLHVKLWMLNAEF